MDNGNIGRRHVIEANRAWSKTIIPHPFEAAIKAFCVILYFLLLAMI
jgi:hypothetical protein